jgi:hypothetical protein
MSEQWKVSVTQRTMFGPGGRHGFGFSVTTFRGAPLLTVTYATEAEASDAEIAFRSALSKAIDVTGHQPI